MSKLEGVQLPKHKSLKRQDMDSNEEWWFYQWALEAMEIGIIQDLRYHPWRMQLAHKEHTKIPAPIKKDPTRMRKYVLFQPCIYTPDFIIQVHPMNNPLINHNLIPTMGIADQKDKSKIIRYLPSYLGDVIVIDVKGPYSLKMKSDQTFPIIRKWLYYHSGMFVNKVVPQKFFKKTWCPESIRMTAKTNKVSKTWEGFPYKEDYIKRYNITNIEITEEFRDKSNKFIKDKLKEQADDTEKKADNQQS